MALEAARMLRSIGRTLLALAAGVACGALLVAAFIYISWTEGFVFEGLFRVSLYYGAAIAAVCVPIWLILAKFGWDRAWAAAALGFVATATFFGLTYGAGSHKGLHLMAYSIVPYAACGAVAALVTWWVGRILRRA